jgi:5-methylcytosine-specific restriction protein A
MTLTLPPCPGPGARRPVTSELDAIDPTTRLGEPGRERDLISPALRRLVFMRDAFTCRWCGNIATRRQEWDQIDPAQPAPFQLDHIVPHAAGGCDHAHNLRVLCRHCNERRSNFASDHYARVLPVVARCFFCAHPQRGEDLDDDEPPAQIGQRFTAFCGTCRSASWTDDERSLL